MLNELVYDATSNKANDRLAIADMQMYLSHKEWLGLLEYTVCINYSITNLFDLYQHAGITGRPFFAMMRKYRLEDFRRWMNNAEIPIITDNSGFPIV